MRARSLNLLFVVCIAIIGVSNWMIRRDFSRPNLNFLPDMAASVPYDSFSVNPNFPDGKTLQQPVPGSIPRGFLPLHFEATSQDYARAEEMQNPYSREDQVALQRGSVVFKTFCLPCHGATGKGDGPVVSRGYPPPPPLFSSPVVNMKDGEIFFVVTYGQRNMPSHATQLSREDRWKAILYIRTLQSRKLPAQGSGPA